jgi:hypothetical protein
MGGRRAPWFVRRVIRAGLAAAGVTTAAVLGTAGPADAALPVFTASQTTGLVSGQQIRVSWDGQVLGLPPVGVFAVFQCAGLFDPSDYYRNCDELVLQDPAASSGSFEVTVHQQLIPDDLTLHTCKGTAGEQCYLVLVAAETLGVNASLPITFGTPK